MSDEPNDDDGATDEADRGDGTDGGINDPLTQTDVEAPRVPFDPDPEPTE